MHAAACSQAVQDASVMVAVATNFSETLQPLAQQFESDSGVTVTLISGSTGKLYAQIVNGAPFDVFLAADALRPQLLEESGFAVPGSGFTYAEGRLALWSADPLRIKSNGADTLAAAGVKKLAIANPVLAPYGRASVEVLKNLGVWPALEDHLVTTENAGQAFALVATGNADLGFVPLSFLVAQRAVAQGSRWDVAQDLYSPIVQRAVLLNRGANNEAATAFLDYLRSPGVRGLIQSAGYGVNE